MADESNKYGSNRNLWRKVYGFKRRKPERTQLVDSNTGVTFSLDLQQMLRHRDFFSIQTAATASIVIPPPPPPPPILAEYDEGLIVFNNTDTALANFSFCFSDTPDAVVLSIEPSINSDDNIIPYGVVFDSCSMSVGLSAPFDGNVRYRAAYSSFGYPANVTSSLVPASGVFAISAGHITASMTTDYTASFPTTGTLDWVALSPWDFFGNFDNDVFISKDGTSFTAGSGSVSGSISAVLDNPIYFIAFFDDDDDEPEVIFVVLL